MSTTTTPNMGLILPVPSSEPGPAYATELINALEAIDVHNHTSGSGVQIPVSAINIDSDLSFNNFNISNLRSVRLKNNSAILTTSLDLNCLYTVAGDLYYNNSVGYPIQLSAGNAINAASIGGIGGDYTTSTALEFYTSSSKLFTFWSDTNKYASIGCGSVTIHNTATTSTPGISLIAPTGLATDYSLTFPTTLPVSGTKILTVDSSGNIADTLGVDGATITISGNTLTVPDGGVTRSKLAALNYAVSASCGASTVTSDQAYHDVTNLSVSLTTTGRPVQLYLIPDGTDQTAGGYYSYVGSSYAAAYIMIQILRGSTQVYWAMMYPYSVYTDVNKSYIGLDTPTAGTYTYKVQIKRTTSTGTTYCYFYKLLAIELT